MKKAIHNLFGLLGLKVSRIEKKSFTPTAKQYFNTGQLNPLEENSQELYDAFYADDHALEEYYIPDGYRLKFYDLIIDFLKKEKIPINGKRIIDVGCGIGFLLQDIQKNFQPSELSGSDFSQKAVEFSEKKFPNIKFFQQDLNNPIPGKYDVILCTEVLEHLEKPFLAVKNMINAVDTGGSIIITVPNGRTDNLIEHINFWSPESWKVFLERECPGCTIKTELLPVLNNTVNIAHVTVIK